jgi:hypothetical protein
VIRSVLLVIARFLLTCMAVACFLGGLAAWLSPSIERIIQGTGVTVTNGGFGAPTVSLTTPVAETSGGHGEDVSGIGTGYVSRTAANTWSTSTYAKPALFLSGIITGNGGSQATAHGLGAAPRACWFTILTTPILSGLVGTTFFSAISYGSSNITVTALNGSTYQIGCIA